MVSLCLQLKNMSTDGMFGSDVSSVEDDGTASVAMVTDFRCLFMIGVNER